MKTRTLSLIAALTMGGLMAGTTLATAQDNNNAAPRRGRGQGIEQRMERLDSELKLTDAQKPKVKALLEEQAKKFQELRSDSSLSDDQRREKMRAMREDQTKQMKAILTPEQFEKYQAMPRPGRRGGAQGGQNSGESKKAN